MEEILVGVDGSEPGNAALEWAAVEAGRHGARLRLLHVPVAAGGHELLETAAARAHRVAYPADLVIEAVPGQPGQVLLERVAGAGLVVLGTHGHGAVGSLVAGSAALAVAGCCPVPVVLVKSDASALHDAPVVVGVGVDPSAAVLEAADAQARLRGCPPRLVHAWFQPPVEGFGAPAWIPPLDTTSVLAGVRGHLARELEPWTSRWPGTEPVVVPGFARDVLLEAAAGAGLLVLGRHERPGWRLRALGATTRELIRDAPCPVMVVGEPAPA
ncbi:universal stress protein [Actinocorallia libanotica]|uniref:Universal stress protein n=1 Tax=Actinocorallia libanotica TaxID=46162 RepID=A0ABN1RSI0_9ACTN